MGESVLSRGRSLLGGGQRQACPTAKGKPVNIPAQGLGDSCFGDKCGNASDLGDVRGCSGKSFLFFVRLNRCALESACPEIRPHEPQSTALLAVSGAHPWALENPSETVLFSSLTVPITASGLQGEQPLVLE